MQNIVEQFWVAGALGVVLGLLGYWEKVLPSEQEVRKRASFLCDITFSRRCRALEQLMDAMTMRTGLYTGGGTDVSVYQEYVRADDRYASLRSEVLSVEKELEAVRTRCAVGWMFGLVVIVVGIVLTQAKTYAFFAAVGVMVLEFHEIVRGQRAKQALREIERRAEFQGTGSND